MALSFQTFVNPDTAAGGRAPAGGQSLFKAMGHPLAAERAPALRRRLAAAGRLGVYDPDNQAACFDQLYDLAGLRPAAVFVRALEDLGTERFGRACEPASGLATHDLDLLLVAGFDTDRLLAELGPFLPAGLAVAGLAELRLPADMLTRRDDYLAPLNFATNFAFFRDGPDAHTSLTLPSYWAGYGAADAALWLRLFDAAGDVLATWEEPMPPAGGTLTLDSRAVRRRFGLGDFCGSLFVHAVRIAGHDVVKYAFDTHGDDGTVLSCSHDANAWPAQFYAGLPAPAPGERVTLWVQNSHPLPIPPHAIGLRAMGDEQTATWPGSVAPFGTAAIDCADLLPDLAWPDQIEVVAGKHFVRPRYEIRRGNGRSRIAHANVERTDLKPNPDLARLGPHLGLGYMLPIALPPAADFRCWILPTPMSTAQADLPVALRLKDAGGDLVAERFLGRLPRGACPALDLDDWLAGAPLPSGYGHAELVYDFRDGGAGDGWLHAIARYEQRASGHMAETSFGAHVFNTALTYRDEPQSYRGRPPGLTTRLFLRLGEPAAGTFCHLIYPASGPWHPRSTTRLTLHDAAGGRHGEAHVSIACGGSLFWTPAETFGAAALAAAGAGAWVEVRDTTCRLFGYHGLRRDDVAFSLDHMFGF